MKKDKVLFGDEHCCNSFNLRSPLRNVSSRIQLLILLLKVGFPYILWSGPTNSLHISSPYDIVNNVIHNGNHGAGSKPGKLYHKPTTTQEETINLIQELYELMEDMGYLKSGLISYPLQKENSINRTLTVELGLYDHVVDFMEHLPYINSTSDSQSQRTNWNEPGYQNMFLLSASFADLRDDDTLRRSRDIWCSDQDIDTKLYPSEQQRPDCRSGGETKRKVLPRDLLSLTVAEHIYHHWYPDQRFRNIELPRAGSLLLDLKRSKTPPKPVTMWYLLISFQRPHIRCWLGNHSIVNYLLVDQEICFKLKEQLRRCSKQRISGWRRFDSELSIAVCNGGASGVDWEYQVSEMDSWFSSSQQWGEFLTGLCTSR